MRGRCRSWAHGDELSRNRQGPLLAGFCISEVEISSGGNSVRMHGGQRCKRRGSKEVSGGADIEVSGGSRGRRGWDLLPGTSCLGCIPHLESHLGYRCMPYMIYNVRENKSMIYPPVQHALSHITQYFHRMGRGCVRQCLL